MEQEDEDLFYLELNINEQRVLLALTYVEIVLPMVALQAVPNKNDSLKGLLNYHGSGVPVYDLAELLNLDTTKITINTPLLLVNLGGKQVGLLLKEVLNVVKISNSKIQHPSLSNVKPYVSGIYETPEQSAWRLNLRALFGDHHLLEETTHDRAI